MFKNVVTSISELRELFGVPMERARLKEHAELDTHCRAFIALSPFVLIATANSRGRCDVSPKGDAPGFVHVLDAKHLVIPDRPGNKRFERRRDRAVLLRGCLGAALHDPRGQRAVHDQGTRSGRPWHRDRRAVRASACRLSGNLSSTFSRRRVGQRRGTVAGPATPGRFSPFG